MSEDGLHPNDKGYQVMAERLRSLGYEPLYPAKRIARGLPAPK
jgi:lysophospholipase L1-like esterase